MPANGVDDGAVLAGVLTDGAAYGIQAAAGVRQPGRRA
jgi:hypothetical protein